MTAAVARRTVLLAMPALPVVATDTASPAGFNCGPTVGDLHREVRRIEAAIEDVLDADEAGQRVDQGPLQDEKAALIARICRTRARDLRGCRLKLELLGEALESGDDLRAEAFIASVERDLDALDRAGLE